MRLAVLLLALIACDRTDAGDYAPATGGGVAVTVHGSGFRDATSVTVCGAEVRFLVVSEDEIRLWVPPGIQCDRGALEVTTPQGTLRSP